MTDHHWAERLSDHVDGELDSADEAALVAHLDACADCSAVLAELRRVRTWAADFDPDGSGGSDWPALRARIERTAGRRTSWSGSRRLWAAAIVLLAFGALVVGQRRPTPQDARVATALDAIHRVGYIDTSEVSLSDQLGALERLLEERGSTLTPETMTTVRESLLAIERALARVRTELALDPGNDLLLELERRSTVQKVRVMAQALGAPRA